MARKPGSTPQAMRSRAAKTAAAVSPTSALAAGAAPAPKKKPVNPAQFFREVRAETRKITWTTRKETWITSVMVGIMVIMASGFLFATDALLSFGVSQILKLANAG